MHDEAVRIGPLLFLRSMRRVLGLAPLWLLPTILLPVLALPVSMAWHAFLDGAVGERAHFEAIAPPAGGDTTALTPDPAFPESLPANSFHWDDLVYSLTASFRHDHRSGLASLDREVGQMGGALALLAMLVGVFVAGGWLQVILERTRGRSLRRFCMGGGRYFFRFTRVLLLLLVLLGVWRWLIYGRVWEAIVEEGIFGQAAGDTRQESLDSEFTVRLMGWIQAGVHFAGFALLLAWATYLRAILAMHDTRSVLKAGGLTAKVILRRPLRTLTPLGMLWLVEVGVASLALGALVQRLESGLISRPSGGVVFMMGLVSVMALAVREIVRGARYHCAVKVTQTIPLPPIGPDPWASIGGPGGPQYPVGTDGESYAPM